MEEYKKNEENHSINNDIANSPDVELESIEISKKPENISSDIPIKKTISETNSKDENSNQNKTDGDKNYTSLNIKVEVKEEIKIAKPTKPIPFEKKPFSEFVNVHLIPEIKKEFETRNMHVVNIKLDYAERPVTGDKCWFIYCELLNICKFWLSFENDDITSIKSFSLCKTNERPSVLESFLIDEKKITLKLIISRILQRLNGQKLLGLN